MFFAKWLLILWVRYEKYRRQKAVITALLSDGERLAEWQCINQKYALAYVRVGYLWWGKHYLDVIDLKGRRRVDSQMLPYGVELLRLMPEDGGCAIKVIHTERPLFPDSCTHWRFDFARRCLERDVAAQAEFEISLSC